MSILQTRRSFVASVSAAGTAGLLTPRQPRAEEGPPETITVHLLKDPTCGAPLSVAEELLRAEGFSDVRFIEPEAGSTDAEMIAKGRLDIGVAFAADVVRHLDAGTRLTVLAGVHPGCLELFAHEPIHNISELKGRRVAIPPSDLTGRMLLYIMTSYVGLDPAVDIVWETSATEDAVELFAAGKADAFLGVPPHTQRLRARKVGRVILNTATDRPWSQYFCCVLVTSSDYVRQYPVATKRAMRAILKSTDMCAADPARAAQRLVDGGFAPRYDEALQIVSDVPYGKWREYDPEDTLRFFALRLRELGFIKSRPQRIIAEGSDWRFLEQIKRELKA